MSKQGKWILGILTFLPAVLFIVFYFSIIGFILANMHMRYDHTTGSYNDTHFSIFKIVASVIGLYAVLYIGLMIYYIRHAIRYPFKSDGDRTLWIILFIMTGYVAYIVYFLTKILKRPEQHVQPGVN